MEYEAKEYLDMLIGALENEEFFDHCPISRDLMRNGFTNKIKSNLNTRGDYHLTDTDINDVWEECVKLHIANSIAEALQEGAIEIAGVDANGELMYEIPVAQTQTVTGYFERIGPYGPFSLN